MVKRLLILILFLALSATAQSAVFYIGDSSGVTLESGSIGDRTYAGAYTSPGTAGTLDSVVLYVDDNGATAAQVIACVYTAAWILVDSVTIDVTGGGGNINRFRANFHSAAISASTSYFIGYNVHFTGGTEMYWVYNATQDVYIVSDPPPLLGDASSPTPTHAVGSAGTGQPSVQVFYHSGGGGGTVITRALRCGPTGLGIQCGPTGVAVR